MSLAASNIAADTAVEPARSRIMDEAANLFLQRGYEGTSLRQLAEVVGMKAGSLYYHFSSKDQLLTAILERGLDVMHEAFDRAEATHGDAEPFPRIVAHTRAHLSALFENGPYTAAHVVTFRTAPDSVRASLVPSRDAYEARWTELLHDLQRTGSVAADIDITVARLALFGAMNSSVEWFDPDRGTLDRFADAIARQFWTGAAA
ncbi:MAG: TetR/AcrR family transcriptional regulator [Ilumatobacteraceae bacterium]|nr:TetR/AcrR family transcriptional regulator [Ilumatobacteraceae bacterium]